MCMTGKETYRLREAAAGSTLRDDAQGTAGFSWLDALAIIGVVALLLVLAVPLLYTSADSAMTSVDEANARSGYAVVSERVLFEHPRDAAYVYDSQSGKAELAYESTPESYGMSGFEARYSVGGVRVTGVASGGFLVFYVSNGVIDSIRWTNRVIGSLYRHESTIYAATDVALASEYADERLRADVDALQVMASRFLGKTDGEILEMLGIESAYEAGLTNDEGIAILGYRNQNGDNPQVSGSTVAIDSLKVFGYDGAAAETATDGFRSSATRMFFSDYLNSGAESAVKIGKLEYDDAGRAVRIKAWVDQTADNGTGFTVPEQLQGTDVKQ